MFLDVSRAHLRNHTNTFFPLPGILIGYSTHRESEPPSCSAEKTVTQNEEVYVPALDWSDLVGLLNDKLSSKAIEDNLR